MKLGLTKKLETKTIKAPRILVIRLSSYGDIAQALSALSWFQQLWPDSKVDWVSREDFAETVASFNGINKVWSLKRKDGFFGLLKMALRLRGQSYDIVYDAHSNIRSHILSLIVCALRFNQAKFIRRHKYRFKRWLLFCLRINLFGSPFLASRSYIEPLLRAFKGEASPLGPARLRDNEVVAEKIDELLSTSDKLTVLIAPGGSWPLKRWPNSYWSDVINNGTDNSREVRYVIVGSKGDSEGIESKNSEVIDLCGKLSWHETLYLLKRVDYVVSNETGVLHYADLLRVPALGIIGPTAFGYPSAESSRVLELHLKCKPCSKDGRGRCKNKTYKACLIGVKPFHVMDHLNRLES